MNNLFLAVAATEEYADILSMESVIEYINLVSMALEALIVLIYVYQLIATNLVHKLGKPVNPHFNFIIYLVVTILWSWVVVINEAISWAEPGGKVNAIMRVLAPIALGLSAFVAFINWVRLKRRWKEAGEISIAIANVVEEMAEKQERDNQPFIHPYIEGDDTGIRASVSRETTSVVAGCNA